MPDAGEAIVRKTHIGKYDEHGPASETFHLGSSVSRHINGKPEKSPWHRGTEEDSAAGL